MRITFPHIGNVYIAVKAMLDPLGVDYVVPPKCNKRTLSLATKYSPEGVCIPFKLNLGNMIEAVELGADHILNVTGHGTCRMGYYFKVQEQILRDMGYDVKMMLTGLSENKLRGFLNLLRTVSNNAPWRKILSSFAFGISKMTALDDMEILANNMRAFEKNKGTITPIYRKSIQAIDDAADYRSLKRAVKEYGEKMSSVDVLEGHKPLKILVVGEIYVVLDPYANMDVEMELGKLGVVTNRSLYLSRWIKKGLFFNPLGIDQWRDVHKAAMPYLKRDIGGDGWETVGEKVISTGRYDGMVHLAPFTCMPEGSAQCIMPSTKEDLPVLAIYCDEQTSKAGMITRLEAFTDMISMKKAAVLSR
ncbi:MAG: CoA protein activase [Dehalococcoidales bacterium]|nr:CoA protein activase [Dehalococcoidales bacterium]